MSSLQRVVHLTFYKCGSQWVRDVLAAPEVVALSSTPLVQSGENLLTGKWPAQAPGTLLAPVYNASFEDWANRRTPADRAVVVLRDPRDQIISTMFSWSHSHADDPYTNVARKPMLALSISDRLQFCISHFSRIEKPFTSWVSRPASKQEHVTSYEKLLADENGEYRRIFDFLGWEVPAATVTQVVQRLSFSARSGRQRGDTNLHSHYRCGMAGDWKNYYTRELGQCFETLYPNLLAKMGYEKDSGWFENLPEHSPNTPANAPSTADIHRLRADLTRLQEQFDELKRAQQTVEFEARQRLDLLRRADQEIARQRVELAHRESIDEQRERTLAATQMAAEERLSELLAKESALQEMHRENVLLRAACEARQALLIHQDETLRKLQGGPVRSVSGESAGPLV